MSIKKYRNNAIKQVLVHSYLSLPLSPSFHSALWCFIFYFLGFNKILWIFFEFDYQSQGYSDIYTHITYIAKYTYSAGRNMLYFILCLVVVVVAVLMLVFLGHKQILLFVFGVCFCVINGALCGDYFFLFYIKKMNCILGINL